MINCYLTEAKQKICPGKSCGGKLENEHLTLYSQSGSRELRILISKCCKCGRYSISKGQYYAGPRVFAPYPNEMYDEKFLAENVKKNHKHITLNKDSFIKGKYSFQVIPNGQHLPSTCAKCGIETKQLKIMAMKNSEKKLYGKICTYCSMCFFNENIYKSHKALFDSLSVQSKAEQIKIEKEDKEVNLCLTQSVEIPKQGDKEFWIQKKRKYEYQFNDKEAFLSAYQLKQCPVCEASLQCDVNEAWVQCSQCGAIFCEEDYKYIFEEPIIIIGKSR